MKRSAPLDRYAPRCENFVLVKRRIAVLGAQSAPRDTGNQPRVRGDIKAGPWLVLSIVLALIWVFSAYEPVAHEVLEAQVLACEATPSSPRPSPTPAPAPAPAPPHAPAPAPPPHHLRPDSTAVAPAAPENLRIVQALEARTQATAFVPESHPYFVGLASRRDCLRAYSLRQAWQLATRENGGYSVSNRRPPAVTYDPQNDSDPRRQDAAKIVIYPTGNNLQNQVRLPIPPHAPESLFLVWDIWFGAEWLYDVHGIPDQKTWQFGSPFNSIHTEVRMRYAMAANQEPGNVAIIDGRQYPAGGYSVGPNITEYNTLAPRTGTFAVQPETWTRLFAYFKAPASGETWWQYSLWAADAQTDPVLIYDRLQIRPSSESKTGSWESFWLEYNTSTSVAASNRPNRPPLVAYARNVVMLKGINDVTALLQRP